MKQVWVDSLEELPEVLFHAGLGFAAESNATCARGCKQGELLAAVLPCILPSGLISVLVFSIIHMDPGLTRVHGLQVIEQGT